MSLDYITHSNSKHEFAEYSLMDFLFLCYKVYRKPYFYGRDTTGVFFLICTSFWCFI